MISLVLLPLLCLFYFYDNESFKEYGALNMNFPDNEMMEKGRKDFDFTVLRKYKEFSFNNSEVLERKKLKEMQLSVRILKKSNDTINGVKIHFEKKTTYAVFIRVIDILGVEENMPFYMNYKNDIWVLMPNKYKKPKVNKEENHRMNCGTQDIIRAETLRLEEN
jgi:hypothetical protein